MQKIEITKEIAQKVVETVDGGLSSGLGEPIPGQMCVEAAVCYAMGMPHGDEPSCVGSAVRSFKIRLNDSRWSSNAARAKGMRRVAVAQLGSDTIDQQEFAKEVILQTARQILPIALRAAGEAIPAHKAALEVASVACEALTEFSQVAVTAKAARAAADAAAHADAAYAAGAAYAAAAAVAVADAAAHADAAYAAGAAYAAAAAVAVADAAAHADAAYAAGAAYAAAAAVAVADAAVAGAAASVADYAAGAASVAADAAAVAAGAVAGAAASVAADAADADAEKRNSILTIAAEIGVQALIKLGSKGVQWLYLCD